MILLASIVRVKKPFCVKGLVDMTYKFPTHNDQLMMLNIGDHISTRVLEDLQEQNHTKLGVNINVLPIKTSPMFRLAITMVIYFAYTVLGAFLFPWRE